jgi:hypothetical protein
MFPPLNVPGTAIFYMFLAMYRKPSKKSSAPRRAARKWANYGANYAGFRRKYGLNNGSINPRKLRE